MSDDRNLLRINRAIAQAGLCSRRKADELILAGRVRVNNTLVETPGLRVDPATDRIEVDGKLLKPLASGSPKHLYLLLNKPPRVMTTLHDPQGRATVLELLPSDLARRRPVPVGRLDFMSEGLLLLSTDGEFVYRLSHPRYHLPKIYEVLVRENVPDSALEIMRKGMRLADGEILAPVEARILTHSKKGTVLELTLIQGVNRQIRRMCKDLGFSIGYLRRVAQGPLRLGKLSPGGWRGLEEDEVKRFKREVGL